MASGKRILGTVSFVIAFLLTMGFLFLLYAKSLNQDDFPFVQQYNTVALVVGAALFFLCCVILLAILIHIFVDRIYITLCLNLFGDQRTFRETTHDRINQS